MFNLSEKLFRVFCHFHDMGYLPGTVRTDALQRVRTVVHDLARRLGEDSAGADGTVSAAARLLALAYPDRLAATRVQPAPCGSLAAPGTARRSEVL